MESDEPSNTITTDVVILVFVAIIVIAGIATCLVSPDNFDGTRWRVFIVTLASLSVVMTFMFYYAIIELQVAQTRSQSKEEHTTVSEAAKKVIKRVADASDIVPCFVSSLEGREATCLENSVRQESTKYSLSYDIFSLWGMLLTRKGGNELGYVSLSLEWAKSHELRIQWQRQKGFFSRRTGALAKMLFSGRGVNEIVDRMWTPACR